MVWIRFRETKRVQFQTPELATEKNHLYPVGLKDNGESGYQNPGDGSCGVGDLTGAEGCDGNPAGSESEE